MSRCSYGHWIECSGEGSGGCSNATVHSSLGASGFYPLVVRPLTKGGNAYWVIVAFEEGVNGAQMSVMADAVMHYRELREVIEASAAMEAKDGGN